MRRLVPPIRVHAVQGDGFGWATVLHSWDGRACPECGAVVIGTNHRAQHQALHHQLDALDEAVRMLTEAVRVIASALQKEGLVSVRDDGGEAEDLDERLTRKARSVVIGGGNDEGEA